MNDKIREVALRVAREMCNEQPLEMRYGVNAEFSIDYLTRCLQELSKDVEPIGWWNGKETAYFEHETDGPVGEVNIPIYLHPQLTEQDKLDAARYKWLRDSAYCTYPAVFKACQAWNTLRGEILDAAIDAAMKEMK